MLYERDSIPVMISYRACWESLNSTGRKLSIDYNQSKYILYLCGNYKTGNSGTKPGTQFQLSLF